MIDAGKLRTVSGPRYRLDEIAEALDTGHKIGNVALLIGNQAVDERSSEDVRGEFSIFLRISRLSREAISLSPTRSLR